LIIAAILALFATQSPSTTEPSTASEPVAIEAPAKQEVKQKAAAISMPAESANQ
jgi:hypothetical protein